MGRRASSSCRKVYPIERWARFSGNNSRRIGYRGWRSPPHSRSTPSSPVSAVLLPSLSLFASLVMSVEQQRDDSKTRRTPYYSRQKTERLRYSELCLRSLISREPVPWMLRRGTKTLRVFAALQINRIVQTSKSKVRRYKMHGANLSTHTSFKPFFNRRAIFQSSSLTLIHLITYIRVYEYPIRHKCPWRTIVVCKRKCERRYQNTKTL